MKKRREINFSKRTYYSLITIGVLLLISVGVYAFGTDGKIPPSIFGHTFGEIQPPRPCDDGQVLTWTGNPAWACKSITATTGGGGSSLPSCSTGQFLQWDGSAWSCSTIEKGIACPEGFVERTVSAEPLYRITAKGCGGDPTALTNTFITTEKNCVTLEDPENEPGWGIYYLDCGGNGRQSSSQSCPNTPTDKNVLSNYFNPNSGMIGVTCVSKDTNLCGGPDEPVCPTTCGSPIQKKSCNPIEISWTSWEMHSQGDWDTCAQKCEDGGYKCAGQWAWWDAGRAWGTCFCGSSQTLKNSADTYRAAVCN